MKIFTFTLIFFFLFESENAMAIEEPSFTVEQKTEVFEIRNYGPTLVAETKVQADFDEAGNKAFRILADYIFGNNTSQTQIEMTAPVSQQSEKIAMTAPVSMSADGSNYVVQFTMPSSYNIKNLPKPNDPRVQIRELPPRRVAVYRYSGSWSEKRYKEKLLDFKNNLDQMNLTTLGDPVFARFNSPFSLWFLRRNEIWFELKPETEIK